MALNANKHGRDAEDVVAGILRQQGCVFDRWVKVGRSIYGRQLHVDFLVRNLVEFPDGIAIESKWQGGAGTVDEKYPYVVRNIDIGAYEHPVIIMATGGGTPQAVEWLRRQVDGRRLVGVFSFDDLLLWLLRRVHIRVISPPSAERPDTVRKPEA